MVPVETWSPASGESMFSAGAPEPVVEAGVEDVAVVGLVVEVEVGVVVAAGPEQAASSSIDSADTVATTVKYLDFPFSNSNLLSSLPHV